MGGARWQSPRERLAAPLARGWASQLELARRLEGHSGCVNTIRWDRDGAVLASGSDDLCVRLWAYEGADNAVREAGALRSCHRQNIFDAAFQPYGGDLIVTTGLDGQIGTVALRGDVDPASVFDEDRVGRTSKLCFQPLSNDVFITAASAVSYRYGHEKGMVLRTDLRDGKTTEIATFEGACTAVDFSPTDPHCYAAGCAADHVKLCDARMPGGGACIEEVPTGEGCVSSVRYHPNGLELLAYRRGEKCREGLLARVDLTKAEGRPGAVVKTYEGALNHDTIAKEAVYLQGGGVVACGSDDGRLFMWDAASGRVLRRVAADKSVVNCVAPHPTLPVVCVSGIDSDIKLFAVPPAERAGIADDADPPARAPGGSVINHDGPAVVAVRETPALLAKAEGLKATGTAAVKAANWGNAAANYVAAIEALAWVPPNPKAAAARRALVLACSGNIAHCHIQMKNYARAAGYCDAVLRLDAANAKALYRKALCLGELGDYDGALALCGAPALEGNPDAAKLAPKIQQKQKDALRRERDKYKAMFK